MMVQRVKTDPGTWMGVTGKQVEVAKCHSYSTGLQKQHFHDFHQQHQKFRSGL